MPKIKRGGLEGDMGKKYTLLFLVAALLVVVINFSVSGERNSLVFASSQQHCVVDKAAGDDFTVKITFKNTGKTEGKWSINIAFEDSSWSQVGTPQNLTLAPEQKETLVWEGVIPTNAIIGSVARLVVYYNDSFEALDWWIHVVPSAELTIESSLVK